jgi:hypothetical protein
LKNLSISTIVALLTIFTSSAFAKNKLYTHNTVLGFNIPKHTPTEAGQNLLYYGGPVIANPAVFIGFWNDRVNSDIKLHMSDFYASYVASEHMDWLSEYNTNVAAVDGRAGTNQQIGKGQFLGEKTITPSVTAKRITDTQVQQEIEKQIDAGNFPRPDNNTIFMMHFSKDIQISIEGMTSCMSFGGYHNAFVSAKYGNVFYAVLPECSSFGGSGSLSSTTFVASHELIEAVTDAFPTPGDKPSYPQAWNAADGNEIADLCTSGGGTLKGAKANYTISLEWSNSRKRCYDGK